VKIETILVIDDDRTVHEMVDEFLSGEVGQISHAHTPEDGLRMATQHLPSLVLLDITMPRMDGLKVCRHLKESERTRDIPVLFLTVDHNIRHLAKALECGGSDYIMKPFNPVELRARVRAALRTKDMIDLLKEQARIDALTGVNNRTALDEALNAAVSLFHRNGNSVSLLMLDVDQFKKINDEHGHGVGDEVLRRLGNGVRGCGRPSDTACRFGGDEFGVILEATDREGAQVAADRLLEAIRNILISIEGGVVRFTVSAGLASSCDMPAGFEVDDLVKAADEALYRAKKQGRDRVVVWG